ncbi:sigma-70 family RNA polymerase sigma factor [Staphylococcus sp. 11261D007BR]
MQFYQNYLKYDKFIHYLLHQHRITYDYEEFYQQMLIKTWELSNTYNALKSSQKDTYFKYKLKYFLIDLIRQKSKSLSTVEETLHLATNTIPLDIKLLIHHYVNRLPPTHRQWFALYQQGFNQTEIATKMKKSTTSVKKYKKETLYFLRHHLLS